MSRYGSIQFVTDELRQDSLVDLDALFGQECCAAAEREGHQPIGEPSVHWLRVTKDVAELQNDLGFPIREGDWEVRVVVDVAA